MVAFVGGLAAIVLGGIFLLYLGRFVAWAFAALALMILPVAPGPDVADGRDIDDNDRDDDRDR